MEHPPPYAHLERGTLLIASPDLEHHLYFRSVILLCDHSSGGSFGVLINKPIEIELPEEIFKPEDLQAADIEMRTGGPMQPNQMMLMHSYDQAPNQTLKIGEGIHLGGDLHFLQELLAEKKDLPIRLCFGYSGWGPGQLEREFLSGNWFLHRASKHLVFEVSVEKIWQEALRELGGKYATLSMIPEDLSLN